MHKILYLEYLCYKNTLMLMCYINQIVHCTVLYTFVTVLKAIAGYDGGLDPRQPVNLEVPNYVNAVSN